MQKHALPPGPPDRFLIGNFPLGARRPLELLTRWARNYGDLFYYRFLNVHVYFLNRPEYIEDVLVTNFRKFKKGRGLESNRLLFGNGLLTSEGEFWRPQRHLCQPAFHRDRIVSYAQVMVDYTERMLGTWRDGETRDAHKDMMRVTLEIVAKVLFGAEVSGQVEEVGGALEEILRQNTRGRMLFPTLMRLPTPGNLRYRRAVRRLERIIYAIIRQRRSESADHGDLLSMLLQARDENGSRMTDGQLRDEGVTLILAGHETTALLLSWTWYLLSQHPEVEERLVAELRQALAGRSPAVADLPRLPYTEKVIKETLRLYPPAYAMARIALEDYSIAGYRVPAGSSVVFSQWVMHRDARYFASPESFRPERWTGEFEKSLPKFAYFPFGGGPRLCIGSSFAMMEAVLLLATIAQRYRLAVVPGPPIVPQPAITLRPEGGVRVVVMRRESAVASSQASLVSIN